MNGSVAASTSATVFAEQISATWLSPLNLNKSLSYNNPLYNVNNTFKDDISGLFLTNESGSVTCLEKYDYYEPTEKWLLGILNKFFYFFKIFE